MRVCYLPGILHMPSQKACLAMRNTMTPAGMAADERTYHQENTTNKLTTPLPFGEGMGEGPFLLFIEK